MAGIVKTVSTVMVITVISKVLGFARDMVLAYFFGASAVTDAYCIAQTIPEFLFSLIVQAIAIGFIPIYLEISESEGKDKADSFASTLYYLGFIAVAVLIAVVYLFTEYIVFAFASGFTASTAELAGVLIRISVWGMVFRLVSAIDSSYLNANKVFSIPAATGIPLDVITIGSIVVAYYSGQPWVLAVGIALSYLSQMVLQRPFVSRLKSGQNRTKIDFKDPHLKKMLLLFLPVAIGVGANQINLLVDRTLASSFVGGVSALNYANKVDNIIENIMILSLATVMFPTFSEHSVKKEFVKLSNDVSKSILATVAVMLPCSVLFAAFSPQMIQMLFGRGMFDTHAIDITSRAMTCYAFGLLFLSLNSILARVMYSIDKVKETSYCSCFSVVVNIVFSLTLCYFLGLPGIALATSIASFALTVALSLSIGKAIGFSFLHSCGADAIKIACAVVIGCVPLFVSYHFLTFSVGTLIAFLISSMLGLICYVAALMLLKVNILYSFDSLLGKRNA